MDLFIIFVSVNQVFSLKALTTFLQHISLSRLTVLAVVLCFPAFLIHLGTIAFIGDEGIRALVAYEMNLSGDFIVPTLNGEPYFNKPPLYNWFIYGMSTLFGYFGEWPSRTTTLLFLACFALTVYGVIRRQFDQLTAVTMALMLLTSGRILFWDSMLGLIDICFSWVIYINFMILYFMAKAQRWRAMFILSYLLFSIAFLLKGLPALVFQGISVLTALQLHGVVKRKLFSADHWLGIGAGILPVLGYYAVYASRVNLDHVFHTLLDQSLQRTATHHGLWKSIIHLFTFPFEQIYHFLPWSLLVAVTFLPEFRKWMRAHEFVRFNFWMLVANLPVYWLSVQVYPRYVLMFIPLFNVIGYYLVKKDIESGAKLWKRVRIVFLAMAGMALAVIFAIIFFPLARSLEQVVWIWVGGTLCMGFAFMGLLADRKRMFIWFAICLLVLRSVFNLVVLPLRKIDHATNEIKEDCQRVGTAYGDRTWYLYGETYPHEVARFYSSWYSRQMIRHVEDIRDTNALYLVDRRMYPDFPGDPVDSFLIEGRQFLALMKPDTLQ